MVSFSSYSPGEWRDHAVIKNKVEVIEIDGNGDVAIAGDLIISDDEDGDEEDEEDEMKKSKKIKMIVNDDEDENDGKLKIKVEENEEKIFKPQNSDCSRLNMDFQKELQEKLILVQKKNTSKRNITVVSNCKNDPICRKNSSH